MTSSKRNAYQGKRYIAIVLDLLLVTLFAVIGRAQHGEALDVASVAMTAWPFLAAAVLGHAGLAVLRLEWFRVWPAGVSLWAFTVVVGMLLRLTTGETAQLAFVIVASIVLAVFLLLPRLLLGRRTKAERAELRAERAALDAADGLA